jgi:hypothetical protein
MPYRYHYDPNQPRVPAGEHEGGRWTGEGNADHWSLQRVQYNPRGLLVQKGLEAALALYAVLSRRDSRNERAILEFRAKQYNREDTDAFSSDNVHLLSRDEVNRICKRLELVQMLTDGAALAERPFRDTMSPTQYGTRIHAMLKNEIDDVKDPNLKAEVSYLKLMEDMKDSKEFVGSMPAEVSYGTKGSIRIDVLERTDPSRVCVYDIKTGRSGLSPARFNEIRRSVVGAYGPSVKQIIITEVRPTP